MGLHAHLQQFSREQSIGPLQADNNQYQLVLDESVHVELLEHNQYIIILSALPSLSDNSLQQISQLKTAMGWSLAWDKANICLMMNDDEKLYLQSTIVGQCDYFSFYQLFNKHCQLFEKLSLLNYSLQQKVEHHDIIRP